MRIILFFLMTFFILTSCSKDENVQITTTFEKPVVQWKTLDKESEMINKYWYIKAPYIWCQWVKKSAHSIEVWTQECTIRNKWITINPSKSFPWFFLEVNSWSWYTSEKLAIQVFDTKGSKSTIDALERVKKQLLKENFIKKEDACVFKKDEALSNETKKIFTLWKENGETCWEYSFDTNWKEVRYFESKTENKNKVIFISQMNEKQLFDEKNIKIIE